MLQFFVTSKVRRRLLVLLWAEKRSGSVAELAELADASFASTHAELKAMQRLQLVRSDRVRTKEVFSANAHHPAVELLCKLAETDVPSRPVSARSDDAELKQKLVALGAPLRGVQPSPVAPTDVLHVLVEGTKLARRDAVVARCMPVCFWLNRDHLDSRALQALSAAPEDKHAVALFLELAGELGGDRRLAGWADSLRDQRLTQSRPFFYSTSSSSARDFALASKWGFRMNVDLDSFRSLFDKFVTK